MFTGLIEELGTIERIEQLLDAARITVKAHSVLEGTVHGDSISVNGVCLTVIEQSPTSFTADVMKQTLTMSTLAAVEVGAVVNLERAVRADDRLGGHIVQGHVDGTSTVLAINPSQDWTVIRFSLDAPHAPLVTNKGSIAVNGVSLTVSNVSPPPVFIAGAGQADSTAHGENVSPWFEVSLIPETLQSTTMGNLTVGDSVNIETDILARQVQRLLAYSQTDSSGADKS